jgi:hypothetical protein
MLVAKRAFTTEDTETAERKSQPFSVNSVASVVSLFRVWFHIKVSGWGKQEGTGMGP